MRCVVIPEAYEGTRGEARFVPPETSVDLLWFGHISNFRYVEAWVQAFRPDACRLPIRLALLTNLLPGMQEACAQLNARKIGLSLHPSAWSPTLQAKALAQCHAVLLPSADHFYTRTKSANRMVESLHAGRFVIAHPLPSYQTFAPWIWQGKNLYDGVRWMLEHGAEITGKIAAAQQYIDQYHSPSYIASLWEHVFTSD